MIVKHGEVTLVAGAGSVSLPRIPATATVQLTPKTLLGTVGALQYSITPGVRLSITSLNPLDLSVVAYVVFA